MKPMNCDMCGYLEKVDAMENSDFGPYNFCMKSYRMIENSNKKQDDCPLNERPKDTADKKGFYLIKDEDESYGEILC